MFTGIITDLGQVRRFRRGDLVDLTIATTFDTSTIPIGASIACSGVCLTVVAVARGEFSVQASAETLACTTIGAWEEGTPVNLEKSLRRAAARRSAQGHRHGPKRDARRTRRQAATTFRD